MRVKVVDSHYSTNFSTAYASDLGLDSLNKKGLSLFTFFFRSVSLRFSSTKFLERGDVTQVQKGFYGLPLARSDFL